METRRVLAILLLSIAFSATLSLGDETEETASEADSSENEAVTEETVDENANVDDEVKEEDDVLVLTTKTFDSVVNDKDVILVEFYAPWCGHCKSLAPEYAKAAKKMKERTPPVPFAKVDATVETDLAQKYDISGYPTLKIFRKGTAYEYDGPRVEEGIVKYMEEQADPNWKPPPEAVITLTKDNFTDVISRESLMLVEFYAPWCGHCKQLAPEYEKAAKMLKEDDPPILLAKVDATVESELAQQYDVQGYPTMKVFRKGKASEYKGKRDQHGIASYMREQVGPSSKILTSLKALTDFMKERDDEVIVGFFENESDKLLEQYLEANNDIRNDYSFAHTFDPAAKKHFGIKGSSIVLFHPEQFRSKFEDKHIVFKGKDPTPADLQKFYEDKRTPLVGEMNRGNQHTKYSKRPLCVVFYDLDFGFEQRTATQFWRKKVLQVANDHRDVTFAIADEQSFMEELKDFALDDSGEEVNVGCFDDKDKKYRMDPDEEFDEDSLRDFVENFKEGNIKPQVKSQPAPKKNAGPVAVVVGKTFEEIVLDSKKDVLIELYAPWCGHCKELEPTYKKLGKKFKDEPNVVIAKMDATANDAPPAYKAEGFPTILFAPANDKKNPVKYEGNRDLESLVKFVKEKATVSLKKAKDEL
ncbi:protein disulfide-isomerase A4-like [Acropora palmata]|uniref:protein disulfide-isomerase A4-like n=1 Tax=Acropora palmata TaxID=6131 RepID=UPI003D9FFB2F